jgi:hypothetical protein
MKLSYERTESAMEPGCQTLLHAASCRGGRIEMRNGKTDASSYDLLGFPSRINSFSDHEREYSCYVLNPFLLLR